MPEKLNCPSLPKADHIYSHATKTVGGLIYLSGQIPADGDANLVGTGPTGSIQAQTEQCIKNLTAVLETCGSSLEKLVKVNIYLQDMNDFNAMNEVYNKMLPSPKPSRTCVAVLKLPRGVDIEIEAVAEA